MMRKVKSHLSCLGIHGREREVIAPPVEQRHTPVIYIETEECSRQRTTNNGRDTECQCQTHVTNHRVPLLHHYQHDSRQQCDEESVAHISKTKAEEYHVERSKAAVRRSIRAPYAYVRSRYCDRESRQTAPLTSPYTRV